MIGQLCHSVRFYAGINASSLILRISSVFWRVNPKAMFGLVCSLLIGSLRILSIHITEAGSASRSLRLPAYKAGEWACLQPSPRPAAQIPGMRKLGRQNELPQMPLQGCFWNQFGDILVIFWQLQTTKNQYTVCVLFLHRNLRFVYWMILPKTSQV